MARIFNWTTGRHMQRKHEIAFWACGIVGLTAILAIAHITVVKPIQEELSTQKTAPPFLQCQLESFFCGQGTFASSNAVDGKMQKEVVDMVFFVKVVNSGSPSIAWKWKLYGTLFTGQSIEANADASASTMVQMLKSGQELKLDPDRYLPHVLAEDPIGNGAGKEGWVVFPIDGVSVDDLNHYGNTFTLEFQDSLGKKTQAVHHSTSKGEPF